MIHVLHISTECYPAAKAGGMGDVVGALPHYLPKSGVLASVIIPKYKTKWIAVQEWTFVQSFSLDLAGNRYTCTIEQLESETLNFPLYVMDIKGLFDRSSIYLDTDGEAFHDEAERYIAFQRSVLDWLLLENPFDVLHCHDHMTGLITFMIKYCDVYQPIKHLPTIFTIHNGQYRGIMNWSVKSMLPSFDEKDAGILDWDGHINGMATAVKCAHYVTTVSPTYMEEMKYLPDSISLLFQSEANKSIGILNGIDDVQWNPKKDAMIDYQLKTSINRFKSENKRALAQRYAFDANRIVIGFIGRFATQKGVDLLVEAYSAYLEAKNAIHFFILGSGDKNLEHDIRRLQEKYRHNVTAVIAYSEKTAHQVYAASDYLIMPSRFEPCGLNQFYSMKYATIPIVRKTGGLKDSVPDIGDDGLGITFEQASKEDILYSLQRVEALHSNKSNVNSLREKLVKQNNSWTKSAKAYSLIYQNVLG